MIEQLLNISAKDNAQTIFRKDAESNQSADPIKVLNALEDTLDLSDNAMNLKKLNKKELELFGKSLNKLNRFGIVGHHYYEIDGKIVKRDITTSLGDRRLYDKKQVASKFNIYA